jgi:tetratricopeptide (TPR) repeat protein
VKRIASCLALLAVVLSGCSTDPKAVSRKYVERGNRYFAEGKFKEASIVYRRALNKYPRSPDAWYRLGLTDSRLGALAEARKDFSRAMDLDPANLDAVVHLGDLDLSFYLLDPADGRTFLADLQEISGRLLKQDPRSFDGLRLSGNIALAKNETAAAIQKFEAANQVKPDQPDLALMLAQTFFASRQDEAGEKFASGVIERHKTFGQMYDALYVHYLRGNRPDLAEQVLRLKITNNPSHGAYLIQLASHYVVMRRPAEASATIDLLTSDPKRFPEGRLAAGDFYVRVHDYGAALRQFEAGRLQRPQQSRVDRAYRKKIAEVLATQGERVRAQTIVAELLKEDSKDPEARALHATLALGSGDVGQIKTAITELEELTKAMSSNAPLHFNLGCAYLARDRASSDAAREQFEVALRIDPHHAPAKLAWAELALSRGESGRGAQAALEVTREDPANPVARLILARSLTAMNELAKAREQLTQLLFIYPDSKDAREQLAELDLREHKYRQAEEGFRGLIPAGDARGSAGLIQCKVAQRRWPEALQMALDQVHKWPDRPDYRQTLAQIYVASGDFGAAAAQFETLIVRDSNSAGLYRQLGEAKASRGDVPGALGAFQKARQLAPSDVAAALDLATLYDRLNRSKEARAEYQTVIQLQPENTAALNNLAYLEAEEGVDLDQALAYAQHAQQRAPDDPNVQDTLALVYIHKNLTGDGVRILRDLVARSPENPAFHLHLAIALYQKGDRPWARRELAAASRNNPDSRQQDKIRELKAKL